MAIKASRKDPGVRVRFPSNLLRALDRAAKTSGRSRNTEILYRLSESLEAARQGHQGGQSVAP